MLLVRELVLLVPEIPLKDQALSLCIANNSLAVASALRVVRGKELQAGKRALAKLTNGAAIAEYLNERHPEAQLWPADVAARAQARSACAQMHSGFFALRGAMPFDLARDEALENVPLDVQVDIDRIVALWSECRLAATASGPYLFGELSLADAFFAPVAVRLRTYRVDLPPAAAAYVEAIYQWPAFQAWQQAGLAERVQ